MVIAQTVVNYRIEKSLLLALIVRLAVAVRLREFRTDDTCLHRLWSDIAAVFSLRHLEV